MKISNGNIEIAFRIDGSDDAMPVLLHHSLATDLRLWDDTAAALAAHFRVIRFDARGHGQSSVPHAPYTFDPLCSDAIALMDALEIAQAHHIGLSMGGMLAQQLALVAPNRISSLVLVSTSSHTPDAAKPAWDDRMAMVRQNGMNAVVDATLQRWFTPGFDDEVAHKRIGKMILDTPVPGYCGWGAAIRELDITHKLSAIQCPVLIIVGEEDAGTPVAMSQAIKAAIPQSELIIMPQASHLLPIERHDDFIALIERFLAAQ